MKLSMEKEEEELQEEEEEEKNAKEIDSDAENQELEDKIEDDVFALEKAVEGALPSNSEPEEGKKMKRKKSASFKNRTLKSSLKRQK